jgi:hypothetical protein
MKDKRQRKRGLETRRKNDRNCGIELQKCAMLKERKKEDWRQGTTEDGRQGRET